MQFHELRVPFMRMVIFSDINLNTGHFCTFVNVLLYKVQFISFMYIIQIKMHDIFKVYFVEHVNVLIILRCFHIIVVYFIKNY